MEDKAMTYPDDRTQHIPSQPTAYTSTPAYQIGEPTDGEVPEQSQSPERPPGVRLWVKILLILVGAVVVAVAGVVVINYFARGSVPGIITPPLVKAQQACDPTGLGTRVADGKKTLVVDGSGEEDTSGVTIEAEACILKQLGAPEAVLAHMDSTRALDGRQTDSWGSFKVAWTYHPDEGFDLVIQNS